jgi:hypothetical protein
MREIIKARATCSSFLLSAKTQNMKAQFGIVNGLEASSNTRSAKPHEFFDHTRGGGAQRCTSRCGYCKCC